MRQWALRLSFMLGGRSADLAFCGRGKKRGKELDSSRIDVGESTMKPAKGNP